MKFQAYVAMIFGWTIILGVAIAPARAQKSKARKASSPAPGLAQLQKMTARFAPTTLRVDTSKLSAGDRQALVKLIEAGRIMNDIFLVQYWSGNPALYSRLQKDATPLGKARLQYFWINKSPWSALDNFKAFLPGVPPEKLKGANFYPEDMTREEFETWVASLSKDDQRAAKGFFTVIRRKNDGSAKTLVAVPYSEEYKDDLTRAANLLKEAADLTDNDSLKTFLNLRADAFLSNDYYASDLAWMDLDAPVDITIGPYETYDDELFGYKAAFETFLNLRDDEATAKFSALSAHLQEIEDNLPIDPKYRNPKLGAAAPIRVVDEVLCSGDGNHGVATAAYNLPNDERVVNQKGSKRVMLKNVQEAKFRSVLLPIARTMLPPAARDVNFESFFTHIVAHELMHGLGPHQIKVDGRNTTPRAELKELYSAIEEAKADITGLFALQYMMDHAQEMKLSSVLPSDGAAQRQLYTTYLASMFRSLRFGLNEAHGKGMAIQFNYLMDRGAFTQRADQTFALDLEKFKQGVRDLDHDLLTLEAQGDYAGAKKLQDEMGVIRPGLKKALDRLQGIPTDIDLIFVTADELAPEKPEAAPGTAGRKRKKK
ncbi:MAG: dipeptidyl-peptidase 3 family protein [Terriglobales bacterium]